jgi:hypothetical protein
MKNIKLYRWSPLPVSKLSALPQYQWVRRMVLKQLGMKHAEFGTLDTGEARAILDAVDWTIRKGRVDADGIERAANYAACSLLDLQNFRELREEIAWRRGEL